MAKTKTRAQKAEVKSKAKKGIARQPTDAEPLFNKDDIVAIPGAEKGLNFKLVKLLEDVFDESENIKVAFLKISDKEKDLRVYYEDTIQGVIADSDIIAAVEVTETHEKVKGKGTRSVYEPKRHSLNKVIKLAKNFEGVVAKDEDEEDEEEKEEDEEEDEEEEEEKPARQIKKVKGRKTAGKDEIEEEEEEEGPTKRTKAAAGKDTTRATKKQKTGGKKGKATKEEDVEEEEEEEEEEGKKGKGKGKGKGKAKKGDGTKPNKYKKGVWNPDVELVKTNEMLESADNHIIDYKSVQSNNKNIIRAVHTKNYKLLEECLAKDYFFSSLFERWSVDETFNALELAFKNNDKKAVHLIFQAVKEKKPKFTVTPRSGLSTFDTGRNSRMAYGHFTRRVQMGRGNKELNAALNKDEGNTGFAYDGTTLQRLLVATQSVELLDLLRAEIPNFEQTVFNHLEHVIISGNHVVGAYLAERLFKASSFGVTKTHMESISLSDPKKMSDFRKPSATAKTINSSITPIHFACINPNAKILETLLAKAPEYSINDFSMRKPVHYAAACVGPEPLKFLIERSADIREGTRTKITPLMIAAQYGRAHNIKVILEAGKDELHNVVTKYTRERMAAVHYAAEGGHLDCVKLLVENGAGINTAGRSKMTPLMFAAAHGNYELVKWILENGGKILAKDKFRKTALIHAVTNGHIQIVSYLLQNGADFKQSDSSDNYPIHYAAAYGWKDIIGLLKTAGADQNVANAVRLTPLTVSLLKNNIGCMEKLLSYPDTDVNCKDEAGRTIIMSAIEALSKENAKQIKFLLQEKKANPNIEDLEGASAVHYLCGLDINALANDSIPADLRDKKLRKEAHTKAVEEFKALQIEVLKLLVDAGANINHLNHEGISPLVHAINTDNLDVCDKLLQEPTLNLLLVNKKDETIYHFLSQRIGTPKGLELFFKVANLTANKDNIFNKADIFGFTPILKFIKSFTGSSLSTLTGIWTKKREEELDRKQAEWEKEHPQAAMEIEKAKGHAGAFDIDEDDEEHDEEDEDMEDEEDEDDYPRKKRGFRGGARTFQTARKSTGGKAPRKMLASKAAFGFGGFGMGHDPLPFAATNDDLRPVTLTAEELQALKDIAEAEFSESVERFIQVLEAMIGHGAKIDDSVLKLRPFRRLGKNKKEEDTKKSLLADIIKKRKESRPQQNHHFGLFGGYNQQQSQKKKKQTEYCPQGNQNALHLIQDYPHPKLLNFILKFGVNINQQDYLKRTPLHFFIKKQHTHLGYSISTIDILDIFVAHNADLNMVNNKKESPIYLAVSQHKPFFMEYLAKKNVDLNAVTAGGDNPLLFTVKNKDFNNTEFLLKSGADPNIRGHRQRTPLHYALNVSSAGADASFELENLLLKSGARINDVDDRGRTPLHYAFVKIADPFNVTRIDPIEVITSFTSQQNCDVTIKDSYGSTALHYAAQRGSQVCALTLLTSGADVNAKDNEENTPLAIAIKSGHPNVAIMLLQSEASVEGEITAVKRTLEEEIKKEKKKAKEEKEKTAMQIEQEEAQPGSDSAETEAESTVTANEDEIMNEIIKVEEDPDLEEEDEDEEEEDNNNNNPYGHRRAMKTPAHFGGFGGGLFGRHHQQQAAPAVDLEGKCSLFTGAIKKNYQGVAYLLLQSGYDLMAAIMDAMNEKKFNYVWTLLSKVDDDEVLRKTNPDGQNLFHTFAIKGSDAPSDIATKIYQGFNIRKISYTLADKDGRTPLHYAAKHNFSFLFNTLLGLGVDINAQDKKGFTPFALQLVEGDATITNHNIYNYINHKANFTLQFQTKLNGEEITMGPLTYLISHSKVDYDLLRSLLNNGVSVNEVDENGFTALIYAIRENDIKLVNFFLSFKPDKSIVDNEGRNAIHHVVQPLEYGSFENVEILNALAKHGFDVNKADETGRTPMHYASLQDSGVMAKRLKALGAKETAASSKLKRGATSVIADVSWIEEEVDYEEDAEKFLEEVSKAEKDMIDIEEKVKPDQACENPLQHEVLYDDSLGAYDLYMTKVDVMRGHWGGNVFYKMQVLRNKNRDYYSVLTRYGRIGDYGQTQNTPFPTKELAIAEFKKIFKSKSGNEWDNKENFKKLDGKYQLLSFTKNRHHKEYLVPFDLKNTKVPQSTLAPEIKTIIKDISDIKMYQQMMKTFNIDTTYLPLAQLNRSLLNEAQNVLFEIKEIQEEIQEERKQYDQKNLDKILKLQTKINEKSSRFYEIIPSSQYRNSPVPPIDNLHILGEKSRMIDSLLDFEISSRIMLGALSKQFEVNPLDYCFNALSIKMVGLKKEDHEFSLVKKYIEGSHTISNDDYLMNVFALERKGEAERISQFKHLNNKKLLWHGSKIANFMGILAQGLRIAPPEALSTGEMFGKGVYFADQFEKSLGYTSDWNYQVNKGYRLLLLCEVALGPMKECREAENITVLPPPFKSVKGMGRQGPPLDQHIVMPNGCAVPIGKSVNYYPNGNWNTMPRLQHNEYIVYDVNQVRVRYLVQVKDQDRNYY